MPERVGRASRRSEDGTIKTGETPVPLLVRICFSDVPKPGQHELLIRVHAAGLNGCNRVSQQILTTLTRISQKAFSMRDKFSD